LEIEEFNTDGNVGGEAYQSKLTEDFYRRVLKQKPSFLKGITYYQFRDRGRLGLEREDPNHPENGLCTPFLSVYKDLIQQPYFQPGETWKRNNNLRMEWRSSDDSDGLGWKIPLKSRPVFLELLFEKGSNLVIKAGKKWYYKKPGVEWLDVTMAAVEWGSPYAKASGDRKAKPFPVVAFAPPANGMNPAGAASVITKLRQAPRLRLIYRW